MEATIQQNNISTNVSINIASFIASGQNALKAIKQHLWFMVKGSWLRVAGAWSLPRLYRRQLRMINALARGIEAHPIITDTVLWVLGGTIVIEAFLSL
jgi:hypothetical protein